MGTVCPGIVSSFAVSMTIAEITREMPFLIVVSVHVREDLALLFFENLTAYVYGKCIRTRENS
jgi:hypothetical protein